MRRLALALIVAAGVSACSGNSVTSPSSGGPGQPTPDATYTLTGQVKLGVSNSGISAATVTIEDGPNAGKSAVTDGVGHYEISGLTAGVMTATATATGHVPSSQAVTVAAEDHESTVNWPLMPTQAWTRSGAGDTVFQMPGYFSQVRIQGAPHTECEDFVVKLAGRVIVNTILGTCAEAQARIYDALHVTDGGGTVEIVSSTAIDWAFNEQR
ncbi:MAG: carboxypeptidase-like regulatory domain-containing protein [Vicinamibacterales bacterium]